MYCNHWICIILERYSLFVFGGWLHHDATEFPPPHRIHIFLGGGKGLLYFYSPACVYPSIQGLETDHIFQDKNLNFLSDARLLAQALLSERFCAHKTLLLDKLLQKYGKEKSIQDCVEMLERERGVTMAISPGHLVVLSFVRLCMSCDSLCV